MVLLDGKAESLSLTYWKNLNTQIQRSIIVIFLAISIIVYEANVYVHYQIRCFFIFLFLGGGPCIGAQLTVALRGVSYEL